MVQVNLNMQPNNVNRHDCVEMFRSICADSTLVAYATVDGVHPSQDRLRTLLLFWAIAHVDLHSQKGIYTKKEE